MKVINTSECEKCKFCNLLNPESAIPKIQCSEHNKTYIYGQRVPCEEMEKKNES